MKFKSIYISWNEHLHYFQLWFASAWDNAGGDSNQQLIITGPNYVQNLSILFKAYYLYLTGKGGWPPPPQMVWFRNIFWIPPFVQLPLICLPPACQWKESEMTKRTASFCSSEHGKYFLFIIFKSTWYKQSLLFSLHICSQISRYQLNSVTRKYENCQKWKALMFSDWEICQCICITDSVMYIMFVFAVRRTEQTL